jgi:dihydrodipicolinate synthase/N-acetylneuraminate lyase
VPGAPPNQVAPDELNELERAFLKESLRQARRLQDRLRGRYQL